MKGHAFKRTNADSLIVVNCVIDEHEIALAVDSGASHTTVDLTALLIAGYEISQSLRKEEIETASGVIEAFVFKIKALSAFGVTKENIEVNAYDFFTYHLLTDFDGVLGLDFFNDRKFCIDLKNEVITIE
jgi:hypothetical protein